MSVSLLVASSKDRHVDCTMLAGEFPAAFYSMLPRTTQPPVQTDCVHAGIHILICGDEKFHV